MARARESLRFAPVGHDCAYRFQVPTATASRPPHHSRARWTTNTLVLIEPSPDYLRAAVPVAGDDANHAAWHPIAALGGLALADGHDGYIARGVAAWREARAAAR